MILPLLSVIIGFVVVVSIFFGPWANESNMPLFFLLFSIFLLILFIRAIISIISSYMRAVTIYDNNMISIPGRVFGVPTAVNQYLLLSKGKKAYQFNINNIKIVERAKSSSTGTGFWDRLFVGDGSKLVYFEFLYPLSCGSYTFMNEEPQVSHMVVQVDDPDAVVRAVHEIMKSHK
jgi:hypothetical protein